MNTDTTPPESQSSAAPEHAIAQKLPLVLWFILGTIVVLAGFGAYESIGAMQTMKSMDARLGALEKDRSVAQVPSTSQSPTTSGSNVTPMTSADDMAAKLLDYLKTYHSQNGQYPDSLPVDGSKLLWRYNYNQIASPTQNCPTDARLFSYSGYANATTHQIDSFDMYYCKGSTRVKLTEANIK